MRTGSHAAMVGLLFFTLVAMVLDWLSTAVRGLWAGALLFLLGWLLIWRTARETEATFTGPEQHRPWLQATGWFFVAAGAIAMVLAWF